MIAEATIDAQALGDIRDLSGSLSERVCETLRKAILSLIFPPGAILRKGVICEQLGVSRSPVSEAFARLSMEGLVDIIPQSSTRVTHLSMTDIREAAFLRQALELAAVTKVASDRTEKQLAWLTRHLRLQELLVEDKDYSGYFQADEEFHSTLMVFTGFPRIVSITSRLAMQLNRARMLLLPTPGRAVETLQEHKVIVDAIRGQNPLAARSAMSEHLDKLLIRLAPLEDKCPELFYSG